MKKEIRAYDCTLRDGTQGENVALTVADKLRISQWLDELGLRYIEGGWPGSNPRDIEFFERARELDLQNSRLAAFGSTRHFRNRTSRDPNLAALIAAATPVVTIFGKSWDLHVEKGLGITLDQNLLLIRESVDFLKQHHREVVFDAEHFFDGYRGNPEYALQVLDAAASSGADWLVLCDTNGGSLTSQIAEATALVAARFTQVGIHTHNDCELGVANSIAAVESGAAMVQGTINGYGERVGNANLTSVIPVIELKLGLSMIGKQRLNRLSSLAHAVAEAANLGVAASQPFVGRSAFAHKGGIHVSAILKDSSTYEHIEPEEVGNRRRVLVSDLSGRSNLVYKLKEFAGDDWLT